MKKPLLVSLTLMLCVSCALVSRKEKTYAVIRVIDGDTIVLDFDADGKEGQWEIVRLAGYDAPEIHGCPPEEKARGLAAKHKLESLILGKKVTFEFQGAGMYNRVRGVIHIGNVNINKLMSEK